MSDLDVKRVQVNTSDQSATPARQVTGSSTKPTIFAAGLTKADAEANGLMDLFTKYNTDGDEVISESEYNTYTTDQQNITSNSGKRIAQGGIYTVQKGDSLSKIANDFGVDLMTLYNNNKDVIGQNMNAIQVGQQLKINKVNNTPVQNSPSTEQKPSTENDSKVKIFAAMTREQAEQIGGETLQAFEAFSTDGKTISKEDFQKYNKIIYTQDLSVERQQELANLTGSEKIELLRKKLNESADFSAVKDYFKGMSVDQEQAMQFFGITPEMLKEAGFTQKEIEENPEKFGEFFAKAVKAKADAEVQNKDSDEYKTIYNRLKAGDFTEFEIQRLGLQKGVQLSEEQLQQYTEKAIRGKYNAAVAAMISDTNTEGHEEYLAAFIHGIKNGAIENNDDLKANTTIIALEKSKGSKYAASMAELVATNTKDFGIYETSEETAILATRSIIDTGSPETVQKLIENNPDKIDIIKNVADIVIASMPDGANKTALMNAVNNGIANVQSAQSGGNSSVSGSRNPSSSTPSYSTNPLSPNNRTIIEGRTHYPTPSENSWETASPEAKSAVNIIRNEMSTPEQVRYSKAKIQGIPKEKLLSLIAENYALIPDKYKTHIRNYFGQMPMNTRFDMYLRGSDDLRTFMDTQHFMKQTELYSYLKGHHAELVSAPESVQEAFELWQQENPE
ncbi:MAG: LysM peptidoglycan-binding domain-containing protein [Candidatus Gastranaerophilales bacterium]|nr:LysM peptidoglycan-binding domain-containing protein [Candidatus Gastranaerophilales bacterium]